MRAEGVTETLDMAHVRHKSRLLSYNGPSCIAEDLAA